MKRTELDIIKGVVMTIGAAWLCLVWGVVGTLLLVRMMGCAMTPELQPGVVEVEPLPVKPIPMPRDGARLHGGVVVTE